MSEQQTASGSVRTFAIFSIIAGVVGWFASFELVTEYIRTLQDPSYIPNCAVSILVTCGPNMESWQGAILGFSNTIIGVAAFMAPIFIGVCLLAGIRFPKWFWAIYKAGIAAGFVFILWLAHQSIFSLGTLCPWCMVVWVAMIPLFWSTFFLPADRWQAGPSGRSSNGLYSWVWVFILMTYLVIAFVAQVQLNWFAEFLRA